MRFRTLAIAAAAAIAVTAVPAAAGATTVPPTEPAEPTDAETSVPVGTIPDPAACAEGLTLEEGLLTVATGDPAFPPYVIDDAPESGEGFEAAIAYAVADQLGFAEDAVEWVRTPFDAAIAPGPKDFDFNLQQYSITEDRLEVVSFSVPYYTSTQAVVAGPDSPAIGATTLPELQELRLGVAAGTTSLGLVEDVIQPSADPQVFNTNADAVQALSTQQVDGLVVDLPTALFLAAAQIEGGVVVGQFPPVDAAPGEDWGLMFEQDNPLVECVDYALLRLRESGELDEITTTWMEEATEVPTFDLE
jgi:polar amino acid transport system substrate-binding protein